jgi:ATP-dependent helicase Lhr and Lhr-like helicase
LLNGRRRRRKPAYSIDSAGRWALVRRPATPERKEGCRPGANCSERLESRGEIRGGRFISGFSGEQFALPEAIGMLRATRRHPTADQWVSVSGADPLNLVGILTSGPRLPALAGNRLSNRDGIPTAVLIADDIQFLEALDDATEWTAQKELLRSSSEPSVTKGAPSSSHRVVKKNRL